MHLEDISQLELSKKFMPVLICASKKRNGSELVIEDQIINIDATPGHRPNDLINDLNMTRLEYILGHQNLISFMAFQLYNKPYYRLMRAVFGDRFFIQSAGFGIVRSDLKLPNYNITFKGNNTNQRDFIANEGNGYFDLNQILDSGITNEDLVFVGSIDYLKQFIELTSGMPNRKIIFYKGNPILRPYRNLNQQFVFVKYEPETIGRAWHYELADRLAESEIIQRI